MESLSETYPPQITLAIYQKWNKNTHGTTRGEEKFINYFKNKNFVYRTFNREDLIYDGVIECIENFQYIKTTHICVVDYKLSPVIMYRFKDRDFCIKHNGIEKFQKLWRKFHYKIMPRYKNIYNLQYRRIYGKFRLLRY